MSATPTLSEAGLWDLIEDTNRQYDEYLRISKVLDPIAAPDEVEKGTEPARSWAHPLVLVLRTEGS